MGFFSSIGSFCSSVCSAVSSCVSSVVSRIPNPVETVKEIIETGKKIAKALGLISDDIGHSSSVTENSSAVSVEQMNEILRSYSVEYKQQAERLENSCIDITDDYFDFLISQLEQNQEIKKGIGIKRLKRTQRAIAKKIRGSITDVVSKRLSLDDSKCREIIAMPPSDNKKLKMQNYCKDVLKSANDNLANKVSDALYEQSDEINTFLKDFFDDKERSVTNMRNEFLSLEKEVQKDNFDAEQMQILPKLKLSVVNDIYNKIGA